MPKTFEQARAENELVPGTAGVSQTQITGAEVVGAWLTGAVDAGWTFTNLKEWVKLDADWMSKSVYDSGGDGRVDNAEQLADGTNTVTAAQARTHIDDNSIHFVINDISTSASVAWSGSKINTELGLKANQSSLNAHTGDTSIHFVINDASTTTTVAWSGNKIDTELNTKAVINDLVTNTTNAWSSSKISSEIAASGGVGEAPTDSRSYFRIDSDWKATLQGYGEVVNARGNESGAITYNADTYNRYTSTINGSITGLTLSTTMVATSMVLNWTVSGTNAHDLSAANWGTNGVPPMTSGKRYRVALFTEDTGATWDGVWNEY